MVGIRGSFCALATLAACSGYARPTRTVDANGALPDGEIDAEPATVDAGPQGTPPTAGSSSVSGTTDVASTLTAIPSGFSLGMPAGTYHYSWERCSSAACITPTAIGTNASTYTLVSADAGAYIRVGIYASNSCASGCGSSATANSSVVGLVRRVDLTKGAVCSVAGCTTAACRWMSISTVGFAGGTHTVTCNASNTINPYYTYTTSTFPSNICCYGFPGQTTWGTVDGIRSNDQAW